jgi:hypothetical protein
MTIRRLTTVVVATLLTLGLTVGGSVSLANDEHGQLLCADINCR